MYIKRAIDREYISETGAVSVTTPGLRRYYTEENKELLKNSLGLTAQLLKIAKTWDIIKYYPTVQMSAKFNENIKLYLISYLYRYELDEITENLVVDFLHYLLKLFSVLELEDIGYSSAKFKTFLFGLNIKVVDKNTEIEEIKKDIKSHINKNWDKENIEKEILDYNKNPLVYLSEYIYSKKIDKKFKLPEKYEIEHIMPRSGKNIVQIRIDAGLSDEEEFLSVVNKLGNKMLLEEDINRSIGNAWFRTKIQSSVKEKKGYKDSMFLLAKNMIDTYRDSSEPVWTVEDINKRTEKISKEISDFIFS
jgi:hypothetical protein